MISSKPPCCKSKAAQPGKAVSGWVQGLAGFRKGILVIACHVCDQSPVLETSNVQAQKTKCRKRLKVSVTLRFCLLPCRPSRLVEQPSGFSRDLRRANDQGKQDFGYLERHRMRYRGFARIIILLALRHIRVLKNSCSAGHSYSHRTSVERYDSCTFLYLGRPIDISPGADLQVQKGGSNYTSTKVYRKCVAQT